MVKNNTNICRGANGIFSQKRIGCFLVFADSVYGKKIRSLLCYGNRLSQNTKAVTDGGIDA